MSVLLSNEQIAHDIAVAWAQSAVEKRVAPKTKNLSMVEEYLAAYKEALQKLEQLRTET